MIICACSGEVGTWVFNLVHHERAGDRFAPGFPGPPSPPPTGFVSAPCTGWIIKLISNTSSIPIPPYPPYCYVRALFPKPLWLMLYVDLLQVVHGIHSIFSLVGRSSRPNHLRKAPRFGPALALYLYLLRINRVDIVFRHWGRSPLSPSLRPSSIMISVPNLFWPRCSSTPLHLDSIELLEREKLIC